MSNKSVDKPGKRKSSSPGIETKGPSGPRTKRGKRKSSLNSIKHGIFSQAVILRGESRTDYEAFFRGLIDYWEPVGSMEGALVEKLVVLFWRYRRFLKAETASISIEVVRAEVKEDPYLPARIELITTYSVEHNGLLNLFKSRRAIDRAIDLLEELKADISEKGPDKDRDINRLQWVYGRPGKGGEVSEVFLRYLRVAVKVIAREGKEKEKVLKEIPSGHYKIFFKIIDDDIQLLKERKASLARSDGEKRDLDIQAAIIPSEPYMSRLMRYEASLERALDRTMTQLERLQRMRAGQMIPPPIKVEVTRES